MKRKTTSTPQKQYKKPMLVKQGAYQSLSNPPSDRALSLKSEKKNIDTTSGTSEITFGQTTANLLLLNGCAYGTAATQHIGRTTLMKSVCLLRRG